MGAVIIQNSFSHKVSVLFSKSRRTYQLMENSQILPVDLIIFAVIKQNARFICSLCQNCRDHFSVIKQRRAVIIHCNSIPSLLLILKNNSCIFCVDTRIGNTMNTRIDFFILHLSVTDDHTANPGSIRKQSAGKHSGSNRLGFLSVTRLTHKLLVNSRIVLIHPAFTKFVQSKFPHALPVAVISLRIPLFFCDNAGIKISTLRISKCIIVVSKIHKKWLRKHSSVGCIQCLHIILIQSCDPDASFNSLGKPAEIFRFPWVSFHNVFTDGLNRIICRKCLASHDHGTVKALIKCLLIS